MRAVSPSEGAAMVARPCANCARPLITSQRSRRCYCSDLCSQVADACRYVRRCEADGRAATPEVREAIGIKIAHIASGGYPETERRLPVEARLAVIKRDEGLCQLCGEPGNEIDHIAGRSGNLDNLQLLCHKCHLAKTMSSMVPASEDVLDTIHRPLLARARLANPQQPADRADWDYHRWLRGSQSVPKDHKAPWLTWALPFAAVPSDPPAAATGWPEELDPWGWYEVA